MQLYVFGPGNLSLSDFLERYRRPLEGLDRGVRYLVCDFRGADTLTLEHLKTHSPHVTVLHVGERPRYLPDRYRTRVSSWTLLGGFADDDARDQEAIARCTHFLAVDLDPSRISGTRRNIERCLALGRVSLDPDPLGRR